MTPTKPVQAGEQRKVRRPMRKKMLLPVYFRVYRNTFYVTSLSGNHSQLIIARIKATMSARFVQQTSVDSVYQTMGPLSNKGLKNPSGDNNCFLNSSIQVRERTRLVDVILLGLPVDSLAFGRLPKKLSARARRIASREMPTGQSLRRLFAGSRARLGRVYPIFPISFR